MVRKNNDTTQTGITMQHRVRKRYLQLLFRRRFGSSGMLRRVEW